jgi:hypothetical protein
MPKFVEVDGYWIRQDAITHTHYEAGVVRIGIGDDCEIRRDAASIREAAQIIARLTGEPERDVHDCLDALETQQ